MRHIGRYEIVRELGRGSMGVVYLAVDPRIGRQVALKTIRLPDGLTEDDVQQYRERFRREGMAAGQLNHPHIVTVHDVGDDRPTGASFIVMEYVEGETLRDRIRQAAPLAEDEVRRVGAQLAEGLEYAHQRGIIHRDIKPANVLITAAGEPKIMDFGIARVVDSELTRDEQAIGSPAFMAPEQIRGERIGRTADLFSLGVLLYQMATGAKPFAGNDAATVMYRILNEDPPPPSAARAGGRRKRPALSPELDRIVTKLLRKKPSERYAHGHQVAADLAPEPEAAAAAPRPAAGKPKRKRRAARKPARTRAAAAPSAFIPRTEVTLAVGGAVVLAAVLVLWGWRSGRAAPAAGDPHSAVETGAGTGSSLWPPWIGSSNKSTGGVVVRFEHPLTEGKLTVWIDGRKVLSETLTAEIRSRKLFGSWRLEKPRGTVSRHLDLAPGRHRFEARLQSEPENLDLRAEEEFALADGITGELRIDLDLRFGKRLDLKWK